MHTDMNTGLSCTNNYKYNYYGYAMLFSIAGMCSILHNAVCEHLSTNFHAVYCTASV